MDDYKNEIKRQINDSISVKKNVLDYNIYSINDVVVAIVKA